MIRVPGGVHVGVFDQKTQKVLELVAADRNKKRAVIQEIDIRDFGRDDIKGQYEIINPSHKVDNDIIIEKRWNEIKKWYEDSIANGKYLVYDVSGENNQNKWNCEVLAEKVMTGVPYNPNGQFAAWLSNLGINVSKIVNDSTTNLVSGEIEKMTNLNLNTYSIIVLGVKRSGKTVFLASLFNKLGVINPNFGFILKAEDRDQRKKLNDIYQKISSRKAWPKGTERQDTSEWIFTVMLNNYAACQFKYLDYSGGVITEPNFNIEKFDEFLKQTDAILAILDGQKILALMLNNKEENKKLLPEWVENFQDEFRNDVISIILQIQDIQESESRLEMNVKPIHFLITKWDLLIEHGFNFTQVKETLLENVKLNNFLEEKQKDKEKNTIVRFIPVSSVGEGFTKILDNGDIEKIGLRDPEPFQVEIPLVCILPDIIRTEKNRIQEILGMEEEKIYDALQREQLNLTAKDRRNEKIARFTRFASFVLPFGKKIRSWADNIEKDVKDKRKTHHEAQEARKQELTECRNKIKRASDAFEGMMDIFKILERDFGRSFPDSEVTEKDLREAHLRIDKKKK